MQGRMVAALLASAFLGGCALIENDAVSSFRESKSPAPQDSSPAGGTVQMHVAILQRPLGDDFLEKDLWERVDQHIVPLERQALLEDNGFRLGRVVGMVPAQLMQLLRSERYCINPRGKVVNPGETTINELGEVLPEIRVTVRGSVAEEVQLSQAQFCFDATPVLSGRDRSVRFTLAPRVRHGTVALPVRVAADLSGWESETEKPHRAFPELRWDVTLGPGELLLVGPNLERPGTLGYQSFVQPRGPTPTQRMLVLRAQRTDAEEAPGEVTLADMAARCQPRH